MLSEPLNALLSLLVFGSAATCIVADWRGDRGWVYIFKPLTMVFVLAIAAQSGGADAETGVAVFYRYAVLLGLVFSLAGDVFLMLPNDRFLPGLGSFLLGHLCYIAAFSAAVGFGSSPIALVPFLVAAGAVLALVFPGAGGQRGPVLAYVAVIAIMGWQALARWLALGDVAAALALSGALLFAFSDALIAINRFRRPFAAAQSLVLSSYFAAQWLIALSTGVGPVLLDWALH